MEVIKINPSEYDISNSSDRRRLSKQLAPAIQALNKGAIVAFPTETVYGLGVLATDAAAVQRLRVLKGRPKSPFTVHISKPSEVRWYVKDVPVLARALIYKAWPGAVMPMPTPVVVNDILLIPAVLISKEVPAEPVSI